MVCGGGGGGWQRIYCSAEAQAEQYLKQFDYWTVNNRV